MLCGVVAPTQPQVAVVLHTDHTDLAAVATEKRGEKRNEKKQGPRLHILHGPKMRKLKTLPPAPAPRRHLALACER